MDQFEEDDSIVSSRSPSGRSSSSEETKEIDNNSQVREGKPQDNKNAYNNKDKDSSINKEGRVIIIKMI